MGKGKKKGKKASKSSAASDSEVPTGPTERDILNSLLERLQSVLQSATVEHEAAEARLNQLQVQLEEVDSSTEACVRHLYRQMALQEAGSAAAAQQWQAEKEAAELEARRGEAVLQAVKRNAETEECLFQQEMLQLEEKMNRLKDKRLERLKQTPRLKQLEEAIQQKEAEELRRSREADAAEVEHLLRRRSAFAARVDALAEEGAAVFQLSLPVEAERRMAEDARLRAAVASAAEDALRLQERLRTLKRCGAAAEAEEEARAAAEFEAEEACWAVMAKIRKLEEENEVLEKNKSNFEELDIESLQESLRQIEGDYCRAKDELEDVRRIREDQSSYRATLRAQIEAERNRNGLLASALLRTAQLARARLEEEPVASSPDVDLLQQIAMILKEAEDV